MEKKNFDYSDFSSNDLNETSTFTDLVSRSERKKRQLEKEQEKKLEQTRQIEELKKTLEFEIEKPKKKKEKKQNKKEEPVKEEKPILKEKKGIIIFFYILLLIVSVGIFLSILYYRNYIIEIGYLFYSALLFLIFTCLYGISLFVKKGKKVSSILTMLILIGFLGFQTVYFTGHISLKKNPTLPNFVNQSMSEVISYTSKNNITLTQNYEYSDQVAEYDVITQDVLPGTLTKKVKELTILISNGANPDKKVTIPNMVGYDIDKAVEIIKQNFLNNVTIDFTFSNDVKKDLVISQDKNGEIRRSDSIHLVVSLGLEEELVPVDMIDLTNLSEFDATLWLKRNGIPYTITYEFSNSIKRGSVIRQSEKKGSNVDPKTSHVTLVLSKGKEIEIPNFNQMSAQEATSWIIENKLKVAFEERYDSEYKAGSIIEASQEMGSKVEEGTLITLILSKGKLKMEKFDNIVDFRTWADSLGLAYEQTEEYHDTLPSGSIIKVTPEVGNVIGSKETIKITYSKGKPITVPNFSGMSVSQIRNRCNEVGLRCTYSYQYNNSVSENISYAQSMGANTTVPEGTTVVITISRGSRPSNGGNTGTVNPPVNTCTSTQTHTLIIQPSWVTGGSASTTINTLKSKLAEKYPNVTFNFITRAGNDPAGYIHADSSITSGSRIQDCQTYTIIINE